MNSAADLGGILTVLDVTSLAFAQIIYKYRVLYERDRTFGNRLDSYQARAGFVYFRSCFENVHTRRSHDTV